MRRSARLALSLCLPGLLAAGVASATNYSLWVNGRTGGGAIGNYNDFTYFGPNATPAGVNKKSVNWDGRSAVSAQSGILRSALDCFCTGQNWCYVAVHSAGELLVGYTLANYGGSARPVTNAQPNARGVCTGGTGGSQTGWNIRWVRTSAGSAGGSELADIGAWTTSEPLAQQQKVATSRALYNHNDTRGIWFYRYAGAKGTLYSFALPGQDDEVVAYHSAGGASGSGGSSLCNPGDWFCNDLTLGSGPNQGGRAKWAFHSVVFRDDGEDYGHYTERNWSGVTSLVRRDMEAFAR
ncbi:MULTISPECIES: hypothetical protein [unclassified Massilia]|uniref:hypothetical protein n=1 Tax=unclassified Massilia TaxID=2609279 RepID=UPI001E2D8E8B|nr:MULTISPECIES: hypothetical protein [unclassified Massilia]